MCEVFQVADQVNPFTASVYSPPTSPLVATVSGNTLCAGCVPSYYTALGMSAGPGRRYYKLTGTLNTSISLVRSDTYPLRWYADAVPGLVVQIYNDPTCATLVMETTASAVLVYRCTTQGWMFGVSTGEFYFGHGIRTGEIGNLFLSGLLSACDVTGDTLTIPNATGTCGDTGASNSVVLGNGGSASVPYCP